MTDFLYRTEDIKSDEVLEYFVETKRERAIIDALKARNPVVLVGSRGVGKSFLLRVAQAELLSTISEDRVLPVYVSFSRSSLIHTNDNLQFQNWMLARICSRLSRALVQQGYGDGGTQALSILTGGSTEKRPGAKSSIERLVSAYENSWKYNPRNVDISALPTVDDFKDAVEDICTDFDLQRIVFLIDEAAHVLVPDQQRQFFTLYRDLRSPYLSCKAAVYPGATSYGDTFEPSHDATVMSVERDILDASYLDTMQEIVEKQAESVILERIATHRNNFNLLTYCCSGNPRILLKTVARAPHVSASETNEVIREYYRSDLWAEHSLLPDKYPGYKPVVDWGRSFLEEMVLPDLQSKNDQYLKGKKGSTCFFWIHRDAPQLVKEALRILAYSGIVSEHGKGIKATRGQVGIRYSVNLGALIALERVPTTTGLNIARNLTPKRMSEFGPNNSIYEKLVEDATNFEELDAHTVFTDQLKRSLDVLDVTDWQRGKLRELGLSTVGDVLRASEEELQKAAYVGEKRSRRMRNAAMAAVFEYLSG